MWKRGCELGIRSLREGGGRRAKRWCGNHGRSSRDLWCELRSAGWERRGLVAVATVDLETCVTGVSE